MTEEKKQHAKLQMLKLQDLIGLTDEYLTLKVASFPDNSQAILRIDSPFVVEAYDFRGKTKQKVVGTGSIHSKQLKKAAEIKIQISEGALKLLNKNWPNNSYVGLFAFFSKTVYGEGNPQFVNPFKGTPTEQKSKGEVFQMSEGVEDAPEVVAPKQPDYTEACDKIIAFCSQSKDDFVKNFVTEKIKAGMEKPQAFIDWIKTIQDQDIDGASELPETIVLQVYDTLLKSIGA